MTGMDTQRLLDRWNRFAQSKKLLLDSLMAAAIALVTVVPEFWEQMGANVGWRIALGTVVCVALAFRRTRPDAAGLVIAGAAFIHIAVDDQLSPAVTTTGIIALYSMAAYGSVWGTRAALVLGCSPESVPPDASTPRPLRPGHSSTTRSGHHSWRRSPPAYGQSACCGVRECARSNHSASEPGCSNSNARKN